jgi:sugar lactone lactonase YvrE
MRSSHGREFSIRSIVSLAFLLCIGSLLIPGPAFGAEHHFLETFGSANEPTFSEPRSIAIDQSTGDVLVADAGTGTISRFHEDGTPSEFSALGSNEITSLTFGGPGEVEIAVDNSGGATDGNLYVPQAGAKVVDIFSSTGELIGELTESSEGEFNEPCGVAVDPSGNVYVADFSEHIHKYEPAANPPVNGDNSANLEFGGACTLAAGAGPSEGFIFAAHFFGSLSKLDSSTGVEQYEVDAGPTVTPSVDPTTGNVYSASEAEIIEFDAAGPTSAVEVSNTPLASLATGVAINESTGNVYAIREGSANVEVFQSNYGHHFLETFGSANEPTFSEPRSIAIDQSTGDVLVADAGTGTISRFHEDGTPSEFSALGSNEITSLTFGGPGEVEIAVDNSGGATDGNLYVPQAGAKVVDIFSSTGELIGELTESSEGEFNEPCGVAVDPSGNVYVADFSEHIHKYEPAANPPVNGDNSANLEFGGACTLAAGAGPSEGFIFAAHFFGSLSKLDSSTGVEQYEVDAGPTVTPSVDPFDGHVFSATEAEIVEFNASGALAATELPQPISLASLATGVAINESTGNVYAIREGSANVEVFAPGPNSTPEFELAIQKTGNGSGTVTSLAPNTGINCGTECSAEFEEGTEVELEATPEPKSEFAGWSTVSGDPGTCTGTTSPCTLTLNEATELEAEFNRIAPVVTEVNPTKGPSAGGNTVEITGTELGEATKVEFGTTEATILGNTETSVEVEAPAHAAGTVDVTVTTPGGTSATSGADEYTFVDAPTIEEVNPAEGSTAGGELVEIIGTDLEEASVVEFGGSAATIVGNTNTTIEVETPQHAAGTFHVVVTAIGGTSTETAADEFTFIASPAVTGVSPNKGATTGGNLVEITGLRLGNASKVEFGTTEATILENTETSIEVEAPAHAAGTVDIRVTTLGGTSGKFPQDHYTYEVPTHTLTINKAGSGSGSVSCNGGGCAPSYPEGTKVTLAASPAAGSSFAGWSGGGCSGTGGCTVTLNSNVTVTATFSANPPPPPPPPPPVECVVPKLKGLSLGKAKSALTKAHCKTGKVTRPKKKKGPLVVKSSKPGEGAKRPADTKVDIKLGPKPKKK